MSGILYIVSTPIGNLDDITVRALKVLREVDIIAAEDTRHSRKLLSYYGIEKKLISYWGEREKTRSEYIVSLLKEGKNIALISDAGTPGISDPGEVLIKKTIDASISIVPIPGPSALITALTVSGISTREFAFLGYVPAKRGERKRFLNGIASERRTLVLYESPHRLLDTLADLVGIMPERNIAVAHELTKLNESMFRGMGEHVLSKLQEVTVAGEYVIIIEGAEKKTGSIDEALDEVEKLMKSGKGRKEAANIVSRDYGISKKKLYDMSLNRDEL